MEKQLKTVIDNQDTEGLKALIKNGLDVSSITLLEVLMNIYFSDKTNMDKKLNTDFIMIFIEHGADIKYTEYSEEEWRYYDEINHILITEKIQWSCLQFAFWFYDTKLIKYLLEQNNNVNQVFITRRSFLLLSYPLREAYEHNDLEMLAYLLKKGAVVENGIVAQVRGRYEANKLLLESGVHPNQFTSVASIGSFVRDMFFFLIDDALPFISAEEKKDKNFQQNFIKEVKLFVEHGADVGTHFPIKGLLASNFSYDDVIDMLNLFIEAGFEIDSKDEDGNNLLHLITSQEPLFNEFSGLLSVGHDNNPGDITKKEHKKTKTTTYQMFEKHISETFVSLGGDINAKNNIGMTALMLASYNNKVDIAEYLLDNGADINAKSELTAFDLTSTKKIKELINKTRNHTPQKLVKILSNFTVDKPIKYTTHIWDFDLKEEYGNFNDYMAEVEKQFKTFEKGLFDSITEKGLSKNLYKKIKTFLLDENPDVDYSWSNKVHVNIGWSSLKGLQEWCDAGKDPHKFPIKEPILLDAITELTTFGEIIELFKQEIEVRRDFQNLSTIFENIQINMGTEFNISTLKLERQFYTDAEYFTQALNKIFDGIRKHAQHKEIDVTASESEEGVIELKITHIGSSSTLNAEDMLKEIENGDFLDIKEKLTNLCDWSVEGSHEGKHFRINYLKSNNIKDIASLDYQPNGFTHILKFYKR